MVRRRVTFLALAALAAVTLAACSGSESASRRPQPEEVPVEKGGPVLRLVELNSWYRAMLVDPAAISDPHQLETLARPVCEGETVCRVGVWYDKYAVPNGMPVRKPQIEAQEYAFGRNAEGVETSLWNCNKYPEFEAEGACLPRLLN